jgi:hypothetical protein
MNTSKVICYLTGDEVNLFQNETCGRQKIQEADQSTCALYKTLAYQNSVIGCFGRECAVFNYYVVACMVLFGGVAGGIFLLIMSECTCQPSEQTGRSRRKENEDEPESFDPESALESVEESFESVDLTDGLDDGEEGVIVSFIVQYLCKRGEEFVVGRLRKVAYTFVVFRLLKKTGLKLILVIPLLLRKDWTSSAFFAIDLFIFIVFAFKQKYFPSSLYNEVHVLITGHKFKKVFFLHLTIFELKELVDFIILQHYPFKTVKASMKFLIGITGIQNNHYVKLIFGFFVRSCECAHLGSRTTSYKFLSG